MITAVKTLIGLRLAIATAGQIAAVGISSLAVRSVAYILGFSLGSISPLILPIISLLASLSGAFSGTCLSLEEQILAIQAQNNALFQNFIAQNQVWNLAYSAAEQAAQAAHTQAEAQRREIQYQQWLACCYYPGTPSWFVYSGTPYVSPYPPRPTFPTFLPYPTHAASCNNIRKIWLQTVWASIDENFITPKSCWLIAYSWDDRDRKIEIKYNPYKIKESFLLSRRLNPQLVEGDRLKAFKDSDWKDLESVKGWDKGYWLSEQTDTECRGWQPSWLNPLK